MSLALSLSVLLVTRLYLVLPHALPTRADPGDDFSNNFATDIAPLLALFGENVAKQFMADSMGWKDNIIFAMAPLGIITAIVGAIRVSGPGWLKSIVGRAREGRGDVEVELMSSTSEDVCELWNGQSIVRVMGSPSIVELILLEEPPSSDDQEQQRLKSPDDRCYGIYDFNQAKKDRIILRKSEGGKPESDSFRTAPPNIALNIGGKRPSDRELLTVALLGTMVQAAVVALAGIETYVNPWNTKFKKNSRAIGPYAFPLLVVGTSMLVLGMFMCSRIIEIRSTEEEWGPAPAYSNVKLAWVQKGDTINDQKFNSFAFFSQDKDLHRLRKSIRDTKPHPESQVVIATVISLIGFIAQFSALRFLHWSITISQLVAIAIMSSLRAVARRNLAHKPDAESIPEGYELDWMSRKLRGCQSWELVPLEVSLEPTDDDDLASAVAEARDRVPLYSSRTALEPGDDDLASAVPEARDRVPLYSSRPALEPKDDDLASAVVDTRDRLQIISGWTGRYRKTAESLAGAIEALMNLACTNSDLLRKPELWTSRAEFEWAVAVRATPSVSVSGITENVKLKLKRRRMDGGRWSLWHVSSPKIEALLGLWMLHIHDRSGVESLESGRSLRVLSSVGGEDEEFGLWMPPGTEYLITDNVDNKRLELGVPEHRLFKAAALPNKQSERSSVKILETALHQICAQIIFSTFLSRFAQHLGIITDVTLHSKTARKVDSYGLMSRTVSNIAEHLERSELATLDNAYASIIPVLHICEVLPRSTDPVVFLSALQDIKKQEDDGLYDEAHDALLWLRHRVEAASKSYRSKRAWKDAGNVYLHYYRACKIVYNSSSRTKDAARRMRRFEDIACDVNDAELAGLLHSREWGGAEGASQVYRARSRRQQPSIPTSIPDDSDLLWISVMEGNSAGVASILRESSANVDIPDSRGRTPLIEASSQGFDVVAELLIGGNATVNAKDNDGQTSLHHAVKNQHIGVVELLLLCDKILLSDGDKNSQTPLSIAIEGENEDIVKMLLFYDVHNHSLLSAATAGYTRVVGLLLDKGVDVDARTDSGWTALHLSAQRGHEAVARLLLEKGANVHVTTTSGETALHRAVWGGHKAVTRLLLDKGAHVRATTDSGWSALHLAVEHGGEAVVRLLLEYSADVNVDNSKETALHRAAWNGNVAVVQQLLDKRADIDREDDDGSTALHLAAWRGHEIVVQQLLDKGVDVDVMGYDRPTALHLAAWSGQEAVVRLVLEMKATVDMRTTSGWTALHLAAQNKHKAIVRLLLSKGADVNAAKGGETALHRAAWNGDEETAQSLLNKGSNIHAKTNFGWTALHMAARQGSEAVVRLLLTRGARRHAMNDTGLTAQHLANRNGHSEVSMLLEGQLL
ncbi:MAG: Ankyrin-2 [Trichoglossum hirsutum]|nr:MAG: Ankyrin-2 [Trichoglossum hirsutum]